MSTESKEMAELMLLAQERRVKNKKSGKTVERYTRKTSKSGSFIRQSGEDVINGKKTPNQTREQFGLKPLPFCDRLLIVTNK